MIVDIFFIIVLILMIDYDFVFFSQTVSRKYNYIFEIVSIESTEKKNYLRKYVRDALSIWKASNDNIYFPIK